VCPHQGHHNQGRRPVEKTKKYLEALDGQMGKAKIQMRQRPIFVSIFDELIRYIEIENKIINIIRQRGGIL